MFYIFILICILKSLIAQDIEIKIPMTINNTNPIDHYIYTNRGLKPLSFQNVMKYTEIPPKFNAESPKYILFNSRKMDKVRLFEGRIHGRPGFKRRVK